MAATQDFILGVGRNQPYRESFTGTVRANKTLFYHIRDSFLLNLIAFILKVMWFPISDLTLKQPLDVFLFKFPFWYILFLDLNMRVLRIFKIRE